MKWLHTLTFLPGESHGQRSLAGYSERGHKESDTTETHTHTTMRFYTHQPLFRRLLRGCFIHIKVSENQKQTQREGDLMAKD